MKKENWIWMPHPAHFIAGDKCRFKLATYVGKYIVSTVGELWPDRDTRRIFAEIDRWDCPKIGEAWDAEYFKKFGYKDIGFKRKYETMVFKALKAKTKTECCPYRISSGENIDFLPYDSPNDAYKGHMKLCNKWSKKWK